MINPTSSYRTATMSIPTADTPSSIASALPIFDQSTAIWSPREDASFFHNLQLVHRVQIGGSCVSTGLSLLTGEEPSDIRSHVNTQDPISWSHYLQRHGMKLAYCSTDLRYLQHYVDELLAHDDLFTISTYSPSTAQRIGMAPDENGWICGSHFFVLHRNMVYDTRYQAPIPLREYDDIDRYVKRIFRVVPANHMRGL